MHATAEKVAIIGKAPSSRGLAPYEDPSWEIWTLGDLVPLGQARRWTRHFELHPLHWIEAQNPDYYAWLQAQAGQPIYLCHPAPEIIPAGVPYPLDDVLRRFHPFRYFTNSVSWMIALAIAAGAATIGVWGVDMALMGGQLDGNAEYRSQRPSCEWLLGYAMGAGIEVVVPDESDLLKSPALYGFGHFGNPMRRKWESRVDELRQKKHRQLQRLHEIEARQQETLGVIHAIDGALETCEYFEQWSMAEDE